MHHIRYCYRAKCCCCLKTCSHRSALNSAQPTVTILPVQRQWYRDENVQSMNELWFTCIGRVNRSYRRDNALFYITFRACQHRCACNLVITQFSSQRATLGTSEVGGVHSKSAHRNGQIHSRICSRKDSVVGLAVPCTRGELTYPLLECASNKMHFPFISHCR